MLLLVGYLTCYFIFVKKVTYKKKKKTTENYYQNRCAWCPKQMCSVIIHAANKNKVFKLCYTELHDILLKACVVKSHLTPVKEKKCVHILTRYISVISVNILTRYTRVTHLHN
jgi:hypothetical protein